MRGTDSSELIQVVFAFLLVILTLSFSLTLEAKPSFETYGKAQARLWAKSIASTADALSGTESGSVELAFGIQWDVEVECGKQCKVRVTHEDFEGEKETLTTIEEVRLKNVDGVVIEKSGDSVMIRGGQ